MSRTDSEDCVASWCADDDWCTVTCTAHVLGRKWHPVIVHSLLEHGPMGFSELERTIDGVSSNVLSDSLGDLEAKELVDRTIVNEKPVRVEYSLTRHGTSLGPVIRTMDEWGASYLGDEERSS